MPTFAYACIDPYLEATPDLEDWGGPVDGLYVDWGHPVGDRPKLQQLLQDCMATSSVTLLVRQLSDLGESLATVMAWVDRLESQGVAIHALDQSYATPTDSAALMDRSALVQLSEQIQAQHRSQRLRAGHAQNRIAMLPPPGRAPYGYRRGRHRYALDRTTAPVVKAFFDHFLLFGSIRGSVRYLDKTYGKRIAASTGQRWLMHPAYRGDSAYQDGSIIRDTHTPIISREEAAQVDRLLRRNRRLPPKTVSAPRSLAGLVQCQECQSQLKVSRVTRPRQSREYLYLRPINCGRTGKACRAIAYETVLDATIATVCQALPNAISAPEASPVQALKGNLRAKIEHTQEILQQIPALVDQGILDETTANLRIYALRGMISELEQEASQLPPENLLEIVQTLSIPQFWQDLSESERRVYLREFIKRVLILRDGSRWEVRVEFVF